jgi:hypothetical protein
MQVPPEIASQSEMLEATDRSAWSGSLADESFRLGPYAIKDVDRDWDSGSGVSIGGISHEASEGGYAYELEGKGGKQAGRCVTAKKDTNVGLGSGFALVFQFSKLACSCDGNGKQATVSVESEGSKYKGALTTSGGSYQMRSIHELEGGSSVEKPTGYRMDGDTVGAAEVTHPGRIWLDKKLGAEERREVACLFAGLMLYKPKEDK